MKEELRKTIETAFSRGVSYAATVMIDPENCQSVNNILFQDGSATVRQGTACNASLPAPVVALLKHYNQDGTAYFAAVAGGNLYVSQTSGVFVSVSGETLSGKVSLAEYNDMLFLTNYSNTVKYFDGSAVFVAGISSPGLQTVLADLTNISSFVLSGVGSLALDTNYTHIAVGTAALQVITSGIANVVASSYYDFAHIGDVSSDLNDLITLTTFHNIKTNISSIVLGFQNYNGSAAAVNVTQLSTWIGCSSDGWTLQHTIPKMMFGLIADAPNSLALNQSGAIIAGSITPVALNGYLTSGGQAFLDRGHRLFVTISTPGNTMWVYTVEGYDSKSNFIYENLICLSSYSISGQVVSGPVSYTSGRFLDGAAQTNQFFNVVTSAHLKMYGVVQGGNYFMSEIGIVNTPPPILFTWGSCNPFLQVQSLSGTPAQVTFSDMRLVKTPPMPNAVQTSFPGTTFFGSSMGTIQYLNSPSAYNLQLDGQAVLGAPIMDGTVFYKSTFLRQGRNGMMIESNPTYQSSGCVLSTSISSYLVNSSGNIVSTTVVTASPAYAPSNPSNSFVLYNYQSGYQPRGYAYGPPQIIGTNWTWPDGHITPAAVSGSYYVVSLSGNVLTAYIGVSGTMISSIFGADFIQVTDIPIAPAAYGCTARNIYRRMATDPAFQFVTTITNNSTTVLNDTVPYGVLGQVVDETRWPPPNARIIYAAGNQQMYYMNLVENGVSRPSRVRYSQPYYPYYVPLENVFDISPGDGTQVMGMFEYMGLQYFLKENSTWLFDPSSGGLNLAHNIYGCVAPNSIAQGPQDVFWLSDDGVIRFNFRFENISQDKARTKILLKGLPKQYLTNACGVYFDGLYLLALTTDGGSSNNMVLVYDTVNDNWTQFLDINVNCWDTWGGSQDGQRLFYGNNSGLICEFLTGDADMSSPIPWSIQTKDFGMMTPQVSYEKAFLFTKDLDGQSRSIQVIPSYNMVNDPDDNGVIDTTGNLSGIGLGKVELPAKDGASFFNLLLNSSGRCTLVKLDIYGKEESVR